MREALILVGGLGRRLRSVVPELPKPMAPIQGTPFLEILLARLARHGFTHVVLAVGFRSESIVGYFGPRYRGLALSYSYEETPLGTGGAILLGLQHCQSDHVYIMNGDTYAEFDVEAVETRWRRDGHPILLVAEVPDTQRYGRVLVRDGRVRGFTEKGIAGPGPINAGICLLGRQALDRYEAGTACSFESELLPGIIDRETVEVHPVDGCFIDIGVPEDYARAQQLLAGWDRPT